MLVFVCFAAALTNYCLMLIFSIQCYFEVSPLDEFFFLLGQTSTIKYVYKKKKLVHLVFLDYTARQRLLVFKMLPALFDKVLFWYLMSVYLHFCSK